jgi:acetyl esterase/lipase
MSKKRSLIERPGFWAGVVGSAAMSAGVAYYLYHKEDVDFYIRLYQAKRRADKFYAQYPHVIKDIPFCETQSLDVYRPESGSGFPVLLFIYGGSWMSGNKELYSPAAQLLIPHNVVMVVPDYTPHPAANYQQQVSEVAASIAWTLENIEKYGGDPNHIIVCGHSAGGHLSALALLDDSWLAKLGHHFSEIAGYMALCGVYDVDAQMAYELAKGRTGQLLLDHFEGEQNFALASPLAYVRPGFPPIALIHGDADTTVPLSISETFYAALLAAGNQVSFTVYPKVGHADILFRALSENPSRLITQMVDYVKTVKPV